MANPEILLLAGAPGSGKSTIGKRFVELGKPAGARHLSIGDLKRDIVAGKTPSAFAEALRESTATTRLTGAAPSDAMVGIMEEFILANPDGLTVIDGFPRYADRVEPFKQSMEYLSANVLALCVVEVPLMVAAGRLEGREVRDSQKLKDPVERLADHYVQVAPVLARLAEDYPTYSLDGQLPVDSNARRLLEIYNQHTIQ